LFLFSYTLSAEGFLGGGAVLNGSSSSDPVYTPEVYVTGDYDVFFPFAAEWGVFSNGGGSISYYPSSRDLESSGYIAADGSYRGDLLFARLEAGSYAEYASWLQDPCIRSYGELYLSLDYSSLSLFADPSFVWYVEEGFHSVGTEGTAGISFSLGSFILSPAFLFGVRTSPVEGNERTGGAFRLLVVSRNSPYNVRNRGSNQDRFTCNRYIFRGAGTGPGGQWNDLLLGE